MGSECSTLNRFVPEPYAIDYENIVKILLADGEKERKDRSIVLSGPLSVTTRNVCRAGTGALKMQDRKMTDKDIAGGGKCRTGI